jgi:SPX domain protein involved in polyphosphate accumulation
MDNEDLDFYLGRLEKTEGAEAIRLRWYGDVDNRQVCESYAIQFGQSVDSQIDLRWAKNASVACQSNWAQPHIITDREDWTGERSVKARFPIKSENVDAYLRGEYDMSKDFKAMLAKGKKTQAEVDSMCQLAAEIQQTVHERKLQPVMRTFYNRTAFQLPGDARVRISLDTEARWHKFQYSTYDG